MNESLPKVTALVPSYNHASYIRDRIESILNQTYQNVELIVIDDCSEDDSGEIIEEMQNEYGFQYVRNSYNSGTPFSAWEEICDLATGDFIWICESDDLAAPAFLETAIVSLIDEPSAVIFYCSSIVINEESERIGHTDTYFHDTWRESRWDVAFTVDGLSELVQFQTRGQTVPNMSSAVIKTSAFKAAFDPILKRFKLTGDWLFVGEVMKFGKVVFRPVALNCFREHQVTSRARVKSARSQAEFIITKYRLFRLGGQPVSEFAKLMKTDVIRFLYEPASWNGVVRALLQVSWFNSLQVGGLLLASICLNSGYISKFRERYKHAKTLEQV